MGVVLGINFHHDSSACVIANGCLWAAEEERWSGIKHHRISRTEFLTCPYKSIECCLSEAGVRPSDVELVVAPAMHKDWLSPSPDLSFVPTEFRDRIVFIAHHLSHVAMGAYLYGCADTSVGMCIDAGGSPLSCDGRTRERASGFVMRNGRFEKLYESQQMIDVDGTGKVCHNSNSLGHFYRNMAVRCVPRGDEPEGTMMALACFGDPSVYAEELQQLVQLEPCGQFRITYPFGNYRPREALLIGSKQWAPDDSVGFPFGSRADLAAAAQERFEEAVLHVARFLRGVSEQRTLVFSGGCALNARVNMTLARCAGFQDFLVPPAPNDSGTAVGAALYGWCYVLNRQVGAAPAASWGCKPGVVTDEQASQCGCVVLAHMEVESVLAATGEALEQGMCLGWIQERMEFGPRALGHRSILARPDSTLIRDRLNVIKRRSEIRPFGCAVLSDVARSAFEGIGDGFMNIVAKVRMGYLRRFAGVVNPQNCSRLQLVDPDSSVLGRLLALVRREYDMAGVLNTSFNLKGKPIVRNATEAMVALVDLGLDLLVIDNAIVCRKGARCNLSRILRRHHGWKR